MAETPNTDNKDQEPVLEPGTPEYDAAMAARFDQNAGKTADELNADDKFIAPLPEGGQDKFYDAASGAYDWQSHSKELQYRIDQGAKPGSDADKGVTPSISDNPSDDEVANIVEAAGLKTEDIVNTIKTTGKIDDEQKAALVKQGLPSELIDSYVDMAVGRLKMNGDEIITHAGGEESWNSLEAWAAENLDDAEKTRYNEMLASGEGLTVVDILKQKKSAASPTAGESDLTTSAQTGGTGNVAYESRQEMIRDMQSPEYRDDPAFRRRVHSRVAVSNFESTQYAG